jgi:hypothetical protein
MRTTVLCDCATVDPEDSAIVYADMDCPDCNGTGEIDDTEFDATAAEELHAAHGN